VALDMDEALAALAKLQENSRKARRVRDAGGQNWESALAALRRDAQAAAEEGSPDLYTTLFPPVTKGAGKTKPPEEAPTTAPTPATTPNAA
jgi:hypothetical protein